MITCAHCGKELESVTVCECVRAVEVSHPLLIAMDRFKELRRPKEKNTVELVVGYSSAVAKWIAAGMPNRSEEEIATILETHCKGCNPHYDATTESCAKCGCKVNGSKSALRNKIAMATEDCPIGKW